MKISANKNNFSSINERLKNIKSIICVLSSEDSPDTVFEDIAALSTLSPACEIKIVGDTEVDGIYNAIGKLKEILLVPPKEEKNELRHFLMSSKGEKTDILYCRNAEKNPIAKKYIENINAGIAVIFGNPQKKSVLKGQVLRIEDENAMLKSVMSFIPEAQIKWKLSAEVMRIIKTFLKERGIKKDFFCIDVLIEENFYEFFKNYDSEKVSFLFIGNSEADFSNEKGKIIYSGDISQEYLSALVSLSRGCLVYKNQALLTQARHFEKKFILLDKETMSVDFIKDFIDKNR